MSDEFFNVKEFPKATFASSEIKAGGEGEFSHTVVGNLTLHGETKKITFPATIKMEGDKVMVKSEFVINRKDFGMKYPGKPDDLIRDEVVIKLDLTLNKA
jgi:polyisoprenoid-binding protein YceI